MEPRSVAVPGDDNVYVLLQLVTRPLVHPAFPLDLLGRL